CDHNRHAVDGIRLAEQIMMRGPLLIGTGHGDLHRCISVLHEMPRPRGIGGQPVGNSYDHGVTARAESHCERGGVEQDGVAGLRAPDQRRIGKRTDGDAVFATGGTGGNLRWITERWLADRHLHLERASPLPAERDHPAPPPTDHRGSLSRVPLAACRRDADDLAGKPSYGSAVEANAPGSESANAVRSAGVDTAGKVVTVACRCAK